MRGPPCGGTAAPGGSATTGQRGHRPHHDSGAVYYNPSGLAELDLPDTGYPLSHGHGALLTTSYVL